ncbi:hypothetical protein MPER_09153, partial [Moniliophthora perniciosa FA553]
MDTMESSSRAPRGFKRRFSPDGNNYDGASTKSKRRVSEDDTNVAEDPNPWSGNGIGDYPVMGSGSRSSGAEQSSNSIHIEESKPGDEEIIVTGRRSRFILPEPHYPVLYQQEQTSSDQEADEEDIVSTQLVQPQIGTRLPEGQASNLSHILNDDDVTVNTSAAAVGLPSPLVISTSPSSSSSKGKQKAEEMREPTAEPEATLADYTCPICFSPPTNATLTPCGHICCGSCLFAAIKAALKRGQIAAMGRDEDGAR